jgi:hypothetical protein
MFQFLQQREHISCNLQRPVGEYFLWEKITDDFRDPIQHKLTVTQKEKRSSLLKQLVISKLTPGYETVLFRILKGRST